MYVSMLWKIIEYAMCSMLMQRRLSTLQKKNENLTSIIIIAKSC